MTTTISWPARLPLPTFDAYALEQQDATSRTDMESGPARQRRRFTAVVTHVPVRWRLSQNNFATFEAWFHLKIRDGAEWFALDLLSGIGIASHEARFLGQSGSPYRAVPSRGGIWTVTSTLEVRQRPTLDEGALEILLAEDVTALFVNIAALHSILHADLPVTNSW
jgi:hypothetical protein